MKTTVSGTDDSVQRHVRQTATSSEAKLDIGTITTPGQHIIYTTAQLHETTMLFLANQSANISDSIYICSYFYFL